MLDDGSDDLLEPRHVEVLVTRDAISRFAAAAGITAATHHDIAAARLAGFSDLVAPPYFFVSLGLTMSRILTRRELSDGGIPNDDPLAAKKVMAGETTVRWFGDIVAGDIITVTQTFIGSVAKAGRSGPFEIYTFRRDYSRGGEVVVRETYSRVVR
ncbi:FAS1-like dehydratase domain-containing protein [Arthrobacter sp. B6]|uniref:FAS1-like dehydratase domain-containing protein n=1 Tax=Arthrobacter sp. B6 TaxID=1570137 RepID=UPI000837580B|nr:MaoC family dehydratase N-terminal domain-containing protein [Arthrobacter sp. B6]